MKTNGLGSMVLEDIKTGNTYEFDNASSVSVECNSKYEYDKPFLKPMQKRKHKKKRINKKWAKKYGYIEIPIMLQSWKLETNGKDNTFTFVKENK